MDKIKKLSRFVRYCLWGHILWNLGWHFLGHIHHLTFTLSWIDAFPNYKFPGFAFDFFSLPLWQRLLVSVVSFPSLLFQLLATYSLLKLMNLYEKAEYFTERTSKLFKNIGLFALYAQGLDIVMKMPISYCLTFMNPPGQRMIVASVSNHNIQGIVLALVILLVGWIMERAAVLQEESNATI